MGVPDADCSHALRIVLRACDRAVGAFSSPVSRGQRSDSRSPCTPNPSKLFKLGVANAARENVPQIDTAALKRGPIYARTTWLSH